jgi:hypothetical protein
VRYKLLAVLALATSQIKEAGKRRTLEMSRKSA